MKKIAIFGAGGFGREVLQLVLDINQIKPTWICEGFIVDPKYVSSQRVHGYPILDGTDWLSLHPDVCIVIAVGEPAKRREIALRILKNCSNTFATLVHPTASVGDCIEMGAGSIICAGSILTTDIRIGEHVHINIGCTVGHDSQFHNFVTLSPGVHISGHVGIGDGVEIGTGAVVIPGFVIGDWTVIGAGAVVTKSVPANVIAVGVPANPIRERPADWYEIVDGES